MISPFNQKKSNTFSVFSHADNFGFIGLARSLDTCFWICCCHIRATEIKWKLHVVCCSQSTETFGSNISFYASSWTIFRCGCDSGVKVDCWLIRGFVVRSPAPPVCQGNCPQARYCTQSCSQWLFHWFLMSRLALRIDAPAISKNMGECWLVL